MPKEVAPSVPADIEILWSCSEDLAQQIAEFMAQNVDTNYISHGEILEGRALDTASWHPDLVEILKKELLENFPTQPDPARQDNFICCIRESHGEHLIAIAITAIARDSSLPYATLHDMVRAKLSRRNGNGAQLLQKVEDTLRDKGISRTLIESGVHNEGAHRFFERAGFKQTSTVSCKEIVYKDAGIISAATVSTLIDPPRLIYLATTLGQQGL